MKILFNKYFLRKVKDQYNNLEVEKKTSQPILVKNFQIYYQFILSNAHFKLFNLKIKLANFKQLINKNIADYLERVSSLILNF